MLANDSRDYFLVRNKTAIQKLDGGFFSKQLGLPGVVGVRTDTHPVERPVDKEE